MKIKLGKKTLEVPQNFIDRAINYVDPVRGKARLVARVQTAAASESWTGASKSRRSMKNFNASNTDADGDILDDRDTLVQRSKDLQRNAPIAGGAINTVCTNVVGLGLKMKSRIDREILIMTDDEAEAWENLAEREFSLFADSKNCDIRRTLDFFDLQELAFRSALSDGDVFCNLPFSAIDNWPYTLRLQLIEADRVSNPRLTLNNAELAGGIAKDRDGAPIGYWITSRHPGSVYLDAKPIEWKLLPAFGKETGRRNILHLFQQARIGQSRGVPYLAPVIEPLKQLERYTESELMAAVISSAFTVFVKTENGETSFLETEEVGAGAASNDDYNLASGAIVGLAKGESIDIANPGRPNPSFDPFVQAILRQVGVVLELPYEVLIKQFVSSYSAARGAMLDAWKFYNKRRYWLARNFCQPVYEAFLEEAISLGRISAPGFFSDPLIRKAYAGTEWTGSSPGSIDPLKEVNAAKQRIALEISTRSRETQELTGADWEKVHKQTVKEHKIMDADGILIQENLGVITDSQPTE